MRGGLVALVALCGVAHADEDYGKGTIVFARGQALLRVDAKGRGETEIATFTATGPVRALQTDAKGTVLLVDIAGAWGWMPLDGSTKTITSLPCLAGPATLADDASAVVCRGAKDGKTAVIVLATNRAFIVDVPVAGARVVATAAGMRLVWADASGIWSAPPNDLKQKAQLAPEPPLRELVVSLDGTRAIGVYTGEVFADNRHKKAAEILMGFQLDGVGARRKAIKNAVPLDWSHDAMWILAQDAGSACLMSSHGGEYKCWSGYRAMSTAPDGRWTLVLGNRDGSKQAPTKAPPPKPPAEDATDDDAPPDVAVAMPTGPQSLFRARLEGAFTEKPVLLVRVIDGAAVWVPASP
ncbi:MAG: hypothetical protein JWL86_7005 [Rhizobium sp.]|nr:hypothetical protein [Rhizobium sp.]